MRIEDGSRALFMKYALPCAGTIVRRGHIEQERVDMLIEAVRNNDPIPAGSERIFKVAFAACSLIAIDEGKEAIDSEIIREYYLFRHDAMIDKRYGEMGDFDPDECRIRAGVVEGAGEGFLIVRNSLGSKKYRNDYCIAGVGDLVTTHWDFAVEKIDKATADAMAAQKIALKVK